MVHVSSVRYSELVKSIWEQDSERKKGPFQATEELILSVGQYL